MSRREKTEREREVDGEGGREDEGSRPDGHRFRKATGDEGRLCSRGRIFRGGSGAVEQDPGSRNVWPVARKHGATLVFPSCSRDSRDRDAREDFVPSSESVRSFDSRSLSLLIIGSGNDRSRAIASRERLVLSFRAASSTTHPETPTDPVSPSACLVNASSSPAAMLLWHLNGRY